ncbi:MAG TPA: hypothetical protein VLD15_02320 [Burkholderiales bacterium]|nr:hypothetical protein [Burkholderiales bacterium]
MTSDGARICAVLAAIAALALTSPAFAQTRAEVRQSAQEVDHLFNWYYASVYGTGVYKIGEESVAVLRLPFAYTFRKATEEQWGVKLILPVTAAFAQFDLRDFDLGNVSTSGMTIVPGVEFEVPMSPSWTIRPFLSAGWGREFQRDSSAFIHAIGVSTLYRQPLGENVLSALGGKLVHAGYRSGDVKSTLAALSLGGDLGFPLKMEISGRQAVLGTQLIGTVYFNDLDMLLPASGTEEISYEAEIALTFGVRRAFEVLGIGFDRVGIGYRKGSNGLRGVRLVGSFPF